MAKNPKDYDLATGLRWSVTNKANYREFLPMLYSDMHSKATCTLADCVKKLISDFLVDFKIVDMDFMQVKCFLYSINNAGLHALLKNKNLNIHIVFTGEKCERYMLVGTVEWLTCCRYIIMQMQMKPFNGIRIPWIYHGYVEDMFVHMEWEVAVSKWRRMYDEWEVEKKLIKEAFQIAPLLA